MLPTASFFALSLLIAPGGQAGDRAISGHVEDPSGGAIAGATVSVTCGAAEWTTTTDGAGNFVLRGLPAAACDVEARSDLFTPRRIRIDLTSRQSGFARFVLSVAGIETEVVVTPARGEQERTFDVPEAVTVTTREELESRPFQILPQVLREETGVLVQQTTTAQGSPFIRGFSAQRIVYLMDGIRFNTSTFRAGATQYLGWINPALVQRLEVVRGPASVQYGSDALGGTINVQSLRPPVGGAGGTLVSGHFEGTLGSADRSGGGDAGILVQMPSFAIRTGGSGRRVQDLRPGKGRDSHSALTRFLGLPSDSRYTRLPDTGFGQAGGYVAAHAALGGGASLSGVFLHEEQFGVTRYDRVIGGDGLFRSEFSPQRLDFGYVRYDRGRTGFLSGFDATFSVNRQQDDRLEQARPTSALEIENNAVIAFGYQAQATWLAADRHAVTFGGEVYDEYIDASRVREDPGSRARQALRPEIPDDTRYTSTGLFVQDAADVLDGRLTVRAGARYGRFAFGTTRDPVLGVEREEVVTDAFTFHGGVVWHAASGLNVTFTTGRGFRAANAFDLGAIGITGGGFEVSPTQAAGLGALIGSNDDATAASTGLGVQALEPESVYSFEGGVKLRGSRLAASFNVFDLELVDIIQRRTAIFPTPVAGTTIAGFQIVRQDEVGRAFIATDPRPVVTRVNVDRARIWGVEADAQLRLTPEWIASAHFSLANGHELETGNFLRRMPPPMGGARLKWEPSTRPFWVEGTATFARRQTRLSGGDLSDGRIGARRSRRAIAAFFNGTATDIGLVQNGVLVATGETLAQVQARLLGAATSAPLFTSTPGFIVFGLRGGWRLGTQVDLTLIADNLTDRNYRWHGSGVDAPGFNVQVKTRYRF